MRWHDSSADLIFCHDGDRGSVNSLFPVLQRTSDTANVLFTPQLSLSDDRGDSQNDCNKKVHYNNKGRKEETIWTDYSTITQWAFQKHIVVLKCLGNNKVHVDLMQV